MLNIDFKRLLFTQVKQLLLERIEQFKQMLFVLDEANQGEEKSSSGDKYETGIEMIKQEQNKIGTQLAETMKMLDMFIRLSTSASPVISNGSLVRANDKLFFISIPLGKIAIKNQEIICISGVSPIAQMMKGKQVGDSFVMNENKFTILDVI